MVTASAAENPIDKGSIVLGGTIYFQNQSGDLYENMDGDALTTIAGNPSLGYFISPSILVGADVAFISMSQGDDDLTAFGIGPIV